MSRCHVTAPDGRCVSIAAVHDALQYAGPFLSHLAVFCPPLKLSPPYCPPPGIIQSLLDAVPESLIILEWMLKVLHLKCRPCLPATRLLVSSAYAACVFEGTWRTTMQRRSHLFSLV